MPAQIQADESEADRRKRSKKVYEALIRCVDHNSGRVQPPLAKHTSVLQTLHGAGYGRYGLEEIDRALTAARANGDLFVVADAEGDVWVGLNDRWRLREKIDSHTRAIDEPRRDLIGLANQRVQQLRERDTDE